MTVTTFLNLGMLLSMKKRVICKGEPVPYCLPGAYDWFLMTSSQNLIAETVSWDFGKDYFYAFEIDVFSSR